MTQEWKWVFLYWHTDFIPPNYSHPDGLDSKDSAYNEGEPGSSLGQFLLEKGMATHCSILAWRIPRQRSLEGYSPWGSKYLSMTERIRDPISFDIIVNLLCVKCSAHISLSLAVKKSLIQKKSDPEW